MAAAAGKKSTTSLSLFMERFKFRRQMAAAAGDKSTTSLEEELTTMANSVLG